jgi:hypothetical protein
MATRTRIPPIIVPKQPKDPQSPSVGPVISTPTVPSGPIRLPDNRRKKKKKR